MDILGQKVLFPMDLNRGATIIDLFGRAADKLLIDFASVIILISGHLKPKLAGRREDSEDFLCSVLYFYSIRENTKEEVRRMTRERKKQKQVKKRKLCRRFR